MKELDRILKLPCNVNNKLYNYKMYACTFLIVTGFCVFFLFGTPLALVLILLTVFGGIHVLSMPTYKLELHMNGCKPVLHTFPTKNECIKMGIQSYQFSWSYVHINYSDIIITFEGTNFSSTHGNLISLQMELMTVDGNKIIITRELPPWKDIPEGWDYKLPEDEYLGHYILSNSMIKLRKKVNEIESSSFDTQALAI
ncbi:MAG: hypothetical protein ACPG49_07530 [Chitinophagales bacterium]